jgi:RimJ/RimL family protein N-acetyltransferase
MAGGKGNGGTWGSTMDFAAFNAYHMPALERAEARHCLILSLMARAADENPPGQTRKWSFGVQGACVVQTTGRGLVLGELTREHCRRLAEEVAGTRFVSVLGPDNASIWFVERAKELGERFHEPLAQKIHAISRAPLYPGAEGFARTVTPQDLELFAEWYAAFAAEASPEDDPPRASEIERRAASGDCMFWMAGGAPVSLAGIVRRTRTAAAIALVYTPPALRGRGYAGSVTAAVTDKIFAEGRPTACLYTDLANPWSNRCYAKIGFEPVCESWYFIQQRD